MQMSGSRQDLAAPATQFDKLVLSGQCGQCGPGHTDPVTMYVRHGPASQDSSKTATAHSNPALGSWLSPRFRNEIKVA